MRLFIFGSCFNISYDFDLLLFVPSQFLESPRKGQGTSLSSAMLSRNKVTSMCFSKIQALFRLAVQMSSVQIGNQIRINFFGVKFCPVLIKQKKERENERK